MKLSIGSGWEIVHLTDRVVEIRKDDWAYRRITGRPGFVRVRGEPGMDRQELTNLALETARKNDEELAKRVAKQLMPTARSLAKYKKEQATYGPIFRTPEEPERIGVKRG
jgi:hypothetical protein